MLCWSQRRNQTNNVVGFKWKYMNPIPEATLKWMALNEIKVVVMFRNHLDVLISRAKHSMSNFSVMDHCENPQCVDAHRKVKPHLETGALHEEVADEAARRLE